MDAKRVADIMTEIMTIEEARENIAKALVICEREGILTDSVREALVVVDAELAERAAYPTYAEIQETAAEAAQDVYANSDDVSAEIASQRAIAEHQRVIAEWDRNRPFFGA